MYPKPVKNFISGDYSHEDKLFVEEWMEEEPGRDKELKELRTLWDKVNALKFDLDVDNAWKVVESRLHKEDYSPNKVRIQLLDHRQDKRRGFKWALLFKVAAAFILVGGAAFLYSYNPFAPTSKFADKPVYHTVQSKKGEHLKKFKLVDGTKVVLNSASSVRYTEDYGKKNRIVFLRGEAFFRVNNKGQSHPFVVKTWKATIRDLSTAFNVNSYDNKGMVSVVVAKGKVKVAGLKDSSSRSHHILVSKGEEVEISSSDTPIVLRSANLKQSLGWLDKKLVFQNEAFENIAKEIERFYDVDISVADSSLKEATLTATFKDERLDEVLPALAVALHAEYRVKKNYVLFWKK